MIKKVLSATGILLAPFVFLLTIPVANFGVVRLLGGGFVIGSIITVISGVLFAGCIAAVIIGVTLISGRDLEAIKP